jgi:hypothetical protein
MSAWTSGEYLACFRAGYAASTQNGTGRTAQGDLAKMTNENFRSNCHKVQNEGHWDSKKTVEEVVADRAKGEGSLVLWKKYGEIIRTMTSTYNPLYLSLEGHKSKSGTQHPELYARMFKRIYIKEQYDKATESEKAKARGAASRLKAAADAAKKEAKLLADVAAAAAAAPAQQLPAPPGTEGQDQAIGTSVF